MWTRLRGGCLCASFVKGLALVAVMLVEVSRVKPWSPCARVGLLNWWMIILSLSLCYRQLASSKPPQPDAERARAT